MAISQKHPDFTAFVNGVLAKERTDGTWEALYNADLRPLHRASTDSTRADLQGGDVTTPTVEALDRRIAGLRTTLERIVQNLVELDADVTRQMLDASSSLAGRTAEQWKEAQVRLAYLWSGQQALADTLDQVIHARGSKSFLSRAALGRLTNLLEGPSVAVPRPDGQRTLTEGTVPTDTFTFDDVISRMSSEYELVMAVVNEVAAVWTLIVPRLGALEAMVAELEAAADARAVRRPNALALARDALNDAGDLSRCDPLAVSGEVLTPLTTMIERAVHFPTRILGCPRELEDNLAAAAVSLDECAHVAPADANDFKPKWRPKSSCTTRSGAGSKK